MANASQPPFGPLTYGSVCSGIEAATVAWHPLGWKPAFFSEIEAFPRAVLTHHYPDVPLHGDFTTIEQGQYAAIDLLVGGTPCQDFSVAGLRAGLDGERGNLSLEYLKLAERLRPRWVVWENVPGVLSMDNGRAFGAIVGGLVQLGYHCAYRVLDARHFGVPQRRRRVFLVGYFGDWRPAAAVLFERHSMSGHPAPSREKGQVAPTIPSRSTAGGGLGTDFDCDGGLIAHALRAEGFDASEDGTGRGTPLVPVAFTRKDYGADADETAPTLRALEHKDSHVNGGGQVAIAFHEVAGTLKSCGGKSGTPNGAEESERLVGFGSAVRRLTPRECERLQGFPDDYTLVPYRKKPAADGPRYRALGNSFAVPVVEWIGNRIAIVEQIFAKGKAA